MAVVLLVEDDDALRPALVRALRAGGHVVLAVGTALDGLRTVGADPVDLVVLDLGLPDLTGRETLRLIRGVSDLPVLIATAESDERSAIELLNAGADDYLVKPFSVGHLLARIAALLRRVPTRTDTEPVLTVGALSVDVTAREATLDGVPLTLTRLEFDLLAHLARRAGEVVSRAALAHQVWKQPNVQLDQTIDVHVSSVRRKLGESASEPRYLWTVRGVGVKLVAP